MLDKLIKRDPWNLIAPTVRALPGRVIINNDFGDDVDERYGFKLTKHQIMQARDWHKKGQKSYMEIVRLFEGFGITVSKSCVRQHVVERTQ